MRCSSRTAAVIHGHAGLYGGSGRGAQRGEWREGAVWPGALAFFQGFGFDAADENMQMGILFVVRPYSEKSSPPIDGLLFEDVGNHPANF